MIAPPCVRIGFRRRAHLGCLRPKECACPAQHSTPCRAPPAENVAVRTRCHQHSLAVVPPSLGELLRRVLQVRFQRPIAKPSRGRPVQGRHRDVHALLCLARPGRAHRRVAHQRHPGRRDRPDAAVRLAERAGREPLNARPRIRRHRPITAVRDSHPAEVPAQQPQAKSGPNPWDSPAPAAAGAENPPF